MSTQTSTSIPTVQSVGLLQAKFDELEAKVAAAEAQLKALKEAQSDQKFLNGVKRAYNAARVSCNNPRHVIVCAWNAAKGTCNCKLASKQTEHIRDLKFILSEMVPFKEASCQCERDALSAGVKWNYPGMPCVRWVALGATHVGVDAASSGKRVLPVSYSLQPDAVKYLMTTFPSWFFYFDSILQHDHPISHTISRLAARYVIEDAIPAGTAEKPRIVVDVNGSPAVNLSRDRRVPHSTTHTVCKRHTPKDELRRAMKWGDKFESDGTVRWHDLWDREIGAEGSTLTPEMLLQATATTMFHVLYYYSPAELERYLARCNRDHIVYATVHKHSGVSGTLNSGEQSWVRTKVGGRDWITQTNKLTKETYEHAPLDWIFAGNSVNVSRTHGLTWDTNLIGGDTYLVRLKRFERATIGTMLPAAGADYCPQCAHCEHQLPMKPSDDVPAVRDAHASPNTTEWFNRYGTAVINTGRDYMELEIPKPFIPVLNDMRMRMEGRKRNMEEYQSMLSMLRTKIKAHSVKENVDIEYDAYRNMAQAIFWMDALSSTSSDNSLWSKTYEMSIDSTLLYTRGAHSGKKALVDAAIDVCHATSTRHATLAALIHLRRHTK